MKKTSISDEKRLVRGLHYKRARDALRARDCSHNRPWRFLTIAGPSPHEEIDCIVEVFKAAPNIHITSVDLNEANLSAAIDAGADEVICCDLFDFQTIKRQYGGSLHLPPAAIGEREFDVICLDLTGHVTPALRDLIKIYWKILAQRGVLMITFSYGRDVIEAYEYEWQSSVRRIDWDNNNWPSAAERGMYQLQQLTANGISQSIMARIHYLLGSRCEFLWSVLQYRGKEMPMVSCMLCKWNRNANQQASFEKISEMDFAFAVTAEPEDPSMVFACPRERILQWRRSLAGIKAAATRNKLRIVGNGKTEQKLLQFHPQPAQDHGSTTRQFWSEAELQRLREDYPNHEIDADQLAMQLGRTPGALRQKAFSLGIYRRGPQSNTTQLSMQEIIADGRNEQ